MPQDDRSKILINNNTGETVEKQAFSHTAGGNINWKKMLEHNLTTSVNFSNVIPHDPAILLLRIPKEVCVGMLTEHHLY